MYDLAEKRIGRPVADGMVLGAATMVIGGGFLMAVAVAAWVKNHIVSRLGLISISVPQPTSWTDIALSILITFSAAALLIWRFLAWKRVFSRAIESYVRGQLRPLMEELEETERGLEKRISALESHTDISGLQTWFWND
jgi:hypothetical protein